jgi:D-arabinose 1-dehydrogenase-like Zn-dependent alcohol dehydrogenase
VPLTYYSVQEGGYYVLTLLQIQKGLSIHAWPSGHATDMEDAIEFAQLQDIGCMIEKFPLEKANEAYDAMLSGKVRFRAVLTFE